MDLGLPAARQPLQRVGVAVAGDEGDLEEDQATVPDRGHAAEPGEQVAPDERLDLEEKERAEEDERGGACHRASIGEPRRAGPSFAERWV